MQILKYCLIAFGIPIIAEGVFFMMAIFNLVRALWTLYSFCAFQIISKLVTTLYFTIFLITWRIRHKERADIDKMNQCPSIETNFERLVN